MAALLGSAAMSLGWFCFSAICYHCFASIRYGAGGLHARPCHTFLVGSSRCCYSRVTWCSSIERCPVADGRDDDVRPSVRPSAASILQQLASCRRHRRFRARRSYISASCHFSRCHPRATDAAAAAAAHGATLWDRTSDAPRTFAPAVHYS